MKCSKAVRGIEAYLGGTLSRRKRKRLQAHLEVCRECSSELKRCLDEDSLFRQALEPERLRGSVRGAVMAGLAQPHAHAEVGADRRAAVWLAPIAAAAQFLLAFWLSGVLLVKPVPAQPAAGQAARGHSNALVAVAWTRGLDRFQYFSAKRGGALQGPRHAWEEMLID